MALLLLCSLALTCVSQQVLSAPSSTQAPLINSWDFGADQQARNPNIVDLRKAVSSALGLRQDSDGNATQVKPWGAAAAAVASDLSDDKLGEEKFIGGLNHPLGNLVQRLLSFAGFTSNNVNNVATTGLGGTAPGNNVVFNPSFFGNGGFLFPLFTRGRDANGKAAEKEEAKQSDSKAGVPVNRRQEVTKDAVKRQNNNRLKQKQQQQLKLQQQQQLQNSKQGELFQDDEASQNNHKQLHYYKFAVSRDSADDRKIAERNKEEKDDSEK